MAEQVSRFGVQRPIWRSCTSHDEVAGSRTSPPSSTIVSSSVDRDVGRRKRNCRDAKYIQLRVRFVCGRLCTCSHRGWFCRSFLFINSTTSNPMVRYARFVMATVAQEDRSRVVWPSSPASGWVTGVNRLYGTPNDAAAGLTCAGGGHIWAEGQETHAP